MSDMVVDAPDNGYGGSTGNAGNNSGSGKSSNGGAYNGAFSVARNVGDAQARKAGINPADFVAYTLGTNGEILGITSYSLGGPYSVNLGCPEMSTVPAGSQNTTAPGGTVPYNMDISDSRIAELNKVIADNASLVNSGQSGTRITAARQATLKAKIELAVIMEARKVQPPEPELQDGIRLVADFYSTLASRYSIKASELAQSYAEAAKGKKLRNASEALAAFNKYRYSIASKFSQAERTAIANALKSVEYSAIARDLNRFSKGLGYYGPVSDAVDLAKEVYNAVETNQWNKVFVKLETLAAGKVATVATAFAFSLILGAPMGIIGYAIMMALVSAMVNDSLINSINAKLGIK